MNDEHRELSRRLAAHPRFHPKRGMSWVHDDAGRGVAVDNGWAVPLIRESYDQSGLWREDGWSPDLTDAATGGVLLDMLGDGWLAVRARGWGVHKPGSPTNPPRHHGETLAEACARALLAEWGEVHDGT